jgi:hypothetical protein
VSGGTPYRTEALAVVRPQVEWAFCPWCAHSDEGEPRFCERPQDVELRPWGGRGPSAPLCKDTNPRGLCSGYQPSRLTRLLRVFGRRKAVLVDLPETAAAPSAGGRFW